MNARVDAEARRKRYAMHRLGLAMKRADECRSRIRKIDGDALGECLERFRRRAMVRGKPIRQAESGGINACPVKRRDRFP